MHDWMPTLQPRELCFSSGIPDSTADQGDISNLSHNSVRSCPFFIFEYNVWIVVRNKFSELRIFSGDFTVRKAASGKGPFREIRFVLFINQGKDFPWSPSSHWSPTWSTGRDKDQGQGEGDIVEELHC